MSDTAKHSAAQTALLSYQQADMDGVMVLVSRQAIHEVSDELEALRAENAELREKMSDTRTAYIRLNENGSIASSSFTKPASFDAKSDFWTTALEVKP